MSERVVQMERNGVGRVKNENGNLRKEKMKAGRPLGLGPTANNVHKLTERLQGQKDGLSTMEWVEEQYREVEKVNGKRNICSLMPVECKNEVWGR